jgi:hypothetical protein
MRFGSRRAIRFLHTAALRQSTRKEVAQTLRTQVNASVPKLSNA